MEMLNSSTAAAATNTSSNDKKSLTNNATSLQDKIAKWKRYLVYGFIGFVVIIALYFIYKYYFSSSESTRSLSSAASALLSSAHSSYDSATNSDSDMEDSEFDNSEVDSELDSKMDSEIDDDFPLDDWKDNVPHIAMDSTLLNSLDNLSKYRHASPEVFRDVIHLMESFCKTYYQTIHGKKKHNMLKHELLEKCQKLQTQTIYALHEFTRKFIEESAIKYARERQVEMMGNIREWTDIIKTIMKNYTIHIIRTMRE